ncbi:MAG: ABC transporter ATP-binding protein [Spirochaetes bacterium]|nr:ABC transporter ATP-binding protein [Spirochaetota bacterium]
MSSIELKNVSCSYDGGKTYALKNIDMSMDKEGRYSLLGPSGCGKTTLLKIIAGILEYEGEVFFDGENMRDVPIEERDIAMVFQSPVVYPMTVYDNLIFPIRRKNSSMKEKEKKVQEIADLLGLGSILKAQAHKLGPAEMQTVALGRSLIKDAKILLLDEPLTSIEAEKRLILRTKIKRIQEEEQKIFIYVTHDQTEALTLSDKIAVMDDGRIVQFDTKERIYDRPAHLFVGYFMGSPGMNILEGKVKAGRMHFRDFELPIPPEYKEYLAKHGEFKLGMRPENFIFSKTEKKDFFLFNCIDIQEKGEGVRVLYLKSKDGYNELKAVGTFADIKAGEKVWVHFPIEELRVYDKKSEQIVA